MIDYIFNEFIDTLLIFSNFLYYIIIRFIIMIIKKILY